MSASLQNRLARCAPWAERLAPEQWGMYKAVIAEAQRRNLRFAIGGGLAAATYSGQWLDHKDKDIDFYIRERDREDLIGVVTAAGLEDYFDQKPYDRNWIYRSWKNSTIVDVMWGM